MDVHHAARLLEVTADDGIAGASTVAGMVAIVWAPEEDGMDGTRRGGHARHPARLHACTTLAPTVRNRATVACCCPLGRQQYTLI